ncbi:FkbM family methyltransferase [Stappia taiwanensis]|uniref:FkbM family methyltransferase n=1 Tax=Stappia taiwanensis TaxID=992267 RepID=A0A838XRC3_9HYPH|nr:FkbM family methyltransferase [Stappia taiwanensis]MBA4613005.1 FkbM family methyltransferase [Stappia taiwanensis]
MAAVTFDIDTTSPFGTYPAEGIGRFAWRLADRHELPDRLRKRVRALVARCFRGPYDAEADGLRFRLYPGSNYDDRKIFARSRLPERAEHALLAPRFRAGVTFVDVGANVGSYSLDAARRGARVLAIEANSDTAERLAYNVAANGATTVEIANVAIGAEAGTLALWQEPSNCGFATLVPDLTTGKWAGDWRSRQVTVRPLRDVLADHRIARADVLKVDVEGFEDRVLMPFVTSAPRQAWPLAILLETNCREHWQEDCLAALIGCGYRPAGETADNILLTLVDEETGT